MLVGQALATGELLAPEDGAANWTTPADLAPAAAVVLSRDGEFDGRTPRPAASQSIALEELAAVASEVHGRQITRVTVSEADYRDALIGRGMLLLLHRGARSGAEWAHPLRYLPAGDRYVIFGLNGGATTPRPGSTTSRCTRTPASRSATIPSPSPLSSSPAPSGTGPGSSSSTVHRNAVKPPNTPGESFR